MRGQAAVLWTKRRSGIFEQFPAVSSIRRRAGIRPQQYKVRDAFAWNPGFKEYFAVKVKSNRRHLHSQLNTAAAAIGSSYTELVMYRSLGITGLRHHVLVQRHAGGRLLSSPTSWAPSSTLMTSAIEVPLSTLGAHPRRPVSCRFNPGGLFQLSMASWITPATPNTA